MNDPNAWKGPPASQPNANGVNPQYSRPPGPQTGGLARPPQMQPAPGSAPTPANMPRPAGPRPAPGYGASGPRGPSMRPPSMAPGAGSAAPQPGAQAGQPAAPSPGPPSFNSGPSRPLARPPQRPVAAPGGAAAPPGSMPRPGPPQSGGPSPAGSAPPAGGPPARPGGFPQPGLRPMAGSTAPRGPPPGAGAPPSASPRPGMPPMRPGAPNAARPQAQPYADPPSSQLGAPPGSAAPGSARNSLDGVSQPGFPRGPSAVHISQGGSPSSQASSHTHNAAPPPAPSSRPAMHGTGPPSSSLSNTEGRVSPFPNVAPRPPGMRPPPPALNRGANTDPHSRAPGSTNTSAGHAAEMHRSVSETQGLPQTAPGEPSPMQPFVTRPRAPMRPPGPPGGFVRPQSPGATSPATISVGAPRTLGGPPRPGAPPVRPMGGPPGGMMPRGPPPGAQQGPPPPGGVPAPPGPQIPMGAPPRAIGPPPVGSGPPSLSAPPVRGPPGPPGFSGTVPGKGPPPLGGSQQQPQPPSPIDPGAPRSPQRNSSRSPRRSPRSPKIDPKKLPRYNLDYQDAPVVFETRTMGSHGQLVHQIPRRADYDVITKDIGSCGPQYIRVTTNNLPQSKDELSRSHLPLAAVITPLAQPCAESTPIPLIDCGEEGPTRCSRCRAYINPFVRWLDSDRDRSQFACNLCGARGSVSEKRMAAFHRPEIELGSVEYVAPESYSVRPPMEAWHLFVVDVSATAMRMGATASVCAAARAAVEALSSETRCKVAVMTFDDRVHFYSLKGGTTRMMIMPEIEVLH